MRSRPSNRSSLLVGACLAACVSACAAGGSGSTAKHFDSGTSPLDGSLAQDLASSTANADLTGEPPAPDLLVPPLVVDGGGAVDTSPAGKLPGEACAADSECASSLCKAVVPGSPTKVCVIACTAMADCAAYANLYCEASTAGAATGFCVPRSPAHCASCAQDSDCGALAERCLVGPGDTAPACHIDCALGGDGACPPDYACSSVTDGGKARKLCVPRPVGGVPVACLDALGGYCDRVSLPSPCVRANAAGTCTGERACLATGKRFDKCGAPAPDFKRSCSAQDPAGCTLLFAPGVATTKTDCGTCGHACAAGQDCCGGACAGLGTSQNCKACGDACPSSSGCCSGACVALTTPSSCGSCGNACPGQGAGNDDVSCSAGQCGLTCRGEYYDSDGNPANGCERQHATPPGHDQQSAAVRGNTDCNDGNSQDTLSGTILSDSRVHTNPTIGSFNAGTGSAPDWWQRYDSGGFTCVDDYSLTFSTSGGGNTPCYVCTILTNKVTASTPAIGGNASASISGGKGSYSDGSTIYFKIEKTCSLPTQEAVSYTVSYHL